ncbi:MAG: T9SS type A sorting domain-containing protein, partial [Flavobacteriales bacterium]|nr:T9SS type A sorting domain-containing protein [Flavobacteriales bacterium]
IEDYFSSEFHITASAPLSGAYQLSGVQSLVITKDSTYGAPGYLPFIINTFNTVYNLYPSYSDIYKSPYDTLIPPFFDGSYSIGQLEALIPDTPKAILLPSVLYDFENNPNNPFRLALEDNNRYNWKPTAPMRMYYCEADELVTYKNAIEAKNSMHANGASQVEAVSANPTAGHQDCALYALLQTKFYFELYRNDRFTVQVQTYSASGAEIEDGTATAIPQGGYAPFTYNWNNGMQGETINGLGSGQYSVIVTDANGCSATAYAGIGVVGVQETETAFPWIVYPNPTKDYINIAFTEDVNQGMFALVSVEGDIISMDAIQMAANTIQIPVGYLAKGVYLLSVFANGKHANTRIIID